MKKIALAAFASAAALAALASPALAMETKRSSAPAAEPSRELLALQARMQTLVDAWNAEPGTRDAVKTDFTRAQNAYSNARTADQKHDTAAFDRQVAAFGPAYDKVCASLSGC
ncbi:ABC-type glycerol-3-phosphate transport system substrate-binding protein [Novosphingobium chloroacetimidivorans]|uniref:ABC-type glycerol-3-phosphate transport system substrate-binding protein n=1 Tax=Novosphingobium chloroacetimidivorans TaxID=1428314 RepID=A0A7W7KC93_9SPHN|nr:hypothetical protein [Novosphingobium chloroacetimidivorans]MBB4859614.1 ABC-type glycerol-3-phosphate transport system substrate-binding protein [Novosphingobium chloroacetimidivorans]